MIRTQIQTFLDNPSKIKNRVKTPYKEIITSYVTVEIKYSYLANECSWV